MQFKFSSDLQDKYGTSLGRDTTFVIKSEELKIERTDPANGQYYVYTGNAISISANFSLDQSTVASNVSILPAFDYSIIGSSSLERFSIYPDSTMAPNTEYTVTIGTGLKGLYGGHIKEPYMFTFKTR